MSIRGSIVWIALWGWMLAAVPTASAGVVWDEAVDGDLSNMGPTPTAVGVSLGTNSLLGSLTVANRDYLTMEVPDGLQLSGIVPSSYEGDPGDVFIAVQMGASFTEPPLTPDVRNILGYGNFSVGHGNIGDDILPAIGTAFGAIGFVPPLPSGHYTFWLQQNGAPSSFRLDFLLAMELPGDANNDGQVNLQDFNVLKSNFGRGTTTAQGDFNGDMAVNLQDFNILKANFGKSAAAPVPEPGTRLLAILALLGSLARGILKLPASRPKFD